MPDCKPFATDYTCTECGASEWTIQVSHYGARAAYICQRCDARGEYVRSRPRAFKAEMSSIGRHGCIAPTDDTAYRHDAVTEAEADD